MTAATLALHETDMTSQIPKWHEYSYDGASHSSIGDGGSDMYDEGNMVSEQLHGVDVVCSTVK